jgi:uncharacterized protein (DUF4415 family)
MNDDIRSNHILSSWTDSAVAQHAAHAGSSDLASTTAAAPSMPLKQIVTIRLDVDTLAWFKSAGPGYQTRINQLLRDHMEAQQAQSRSAS